MLNARLSAFDALLQDIGARVHLGGARVRPVGARLYPVGARLLHFLARPHSAGMTPLRPYPLYKSKIVIEIGNCRFRALYYTSFISDFKSMATGFALL